MKTLKEWHTHLLLFIVIGITAAMYFATFRDGHEWGGDFAQYIAQAKALAEGTVEKVVNYSNYTYDMSTEHVGPRLYPWGFPLLLSPIYSIFGLDMFAMKLYVSLFFLLSLVVIYLLFRERLTHTQALLIVLVFAFNRYFFLFKDKVLSDMPFFLFSLFTLLLIQRIVVNRRIWVNRPVSYSLLGFFMFFSYYVRSQAIVLIPTLLVCQYLADRNVSKRNPLSFLISNKLNFVPYIVFLILVAISGIITPFGSASYFEMVSGLSLKNFLYNIYYYFLLPSALFGPLTGSIVLYGITIPFALLGMIKNIKTDYLYLVFMVFTVIMLVFWPYRQGLRFILPILPFYIYFVFVGLCRIRISPDIIPAKYNPMGVNLLHVFCFVVILGSCAGIAYTCYQYPISGKSNVINGPYTRTSTEMFDYIRSSTSHDDVIIFQKPRVMALYTDRRSVLVRDFDRIVNSHGTYIVIAIGEDFPQSWTPLIEPAVVEDHPETFRLVFDNSDYRIYRIIRNK